MGASDSRPLNGKSTALDVVNYFGIQRGEGVRFLEGKTAIVTGGNAGIGLEACKALAHVGARVILCSRSVANGEKAIETEVKKSGEGNYVVDDTSNIVVKQLDLNSLRSVKAFTDDILATEQRIDYLICNAGIMALPKREETEDGFEKQLGVNVFGHFYLIQQLLPKMLKQNFENRIIVLSSSAHSMGDIDVSDLHFSKGRAYRDWTAYGQSKLGDMLLAKSIADKTTGTNTTACSVHPGVIATGLWKSSGPIARFIGSTIIANKNVPQGAATTIWGCLSPSIMDTDRGAYLSDCGPITPSSQQGIDADGKVRKAFWNEMEEQVNAAAAKL